MTKILPSVCSEQLVNKDESEVLEQSIKLLWLDFRDDGCQITWMLKWTPDLHFEICENGQIWKK